MHEIVKWKKKFNCTWLYKLSTVILEEKKIKFIVNFKN